MQGVKWIKMIAFKILEKPQNYPLLCQTNYF